jgi:hypothetical protein
MNQWSVAGDVAEDSCELGAQRHTSDADYLGCFLGAESLDVAKDHEDLFDRSTVSAARRRHEICVGAFHLRRSLPVVTDSANSRSVRWLLREKEPRVRAVLR